MVFGIIMAGGSGTRMKEASMPKQFLALDDKPIIVHSIEKFTQSEKIDKIYIGINPEYVDHMNGLLSMYFPDKEIEVVKGGADRNSTLFNVIAAIEEKYGESDEHVVITHDAVRPFVTVKMIDENVEALKENKAAATVMPSVDTIFVSEDKEHISSVPKRDRLFLAQTPQSFNLNLLKSLYASLTEDEKAVLTDACTICVMRNVPVVFVEGDYANIKITTPSDLKIARAYIKENTK